MTREALNKMIEFFGGDSKVIDVIAVCSLVVEMGELFRSEKTK